MAELNQELIEALFEDSRFLSEISGMFKNNTRQIYRNASGIYGNRHCPGRTMMSAYNNTVRQYYGESMYNMISSFCTHIKSFASATEQLYTLSPYWLQITQTDHENHRFTVDTITGMLWQQTTQNPRIHRVRLIHIASGKTYLREILDNDENIKAHSGRIKSMEMYLIKNTQHFVRVYSGFPNTPEGDLVIFTDMVDATLIRQLYLQFPNIFGLTIEALQTELASIIPADSADYAHHCAVFNDFRNLFNTMYEYVHPGPNPTISLTMLQTRLKAFCEHFANQNGEVEKFITNLSNAQNDKLIRNLTNIIKNADSNIRSYEESLERYYTQRNDAQRQLIAVKSASPLDLTEFKRILLNNKTIEILNAYSTEMRLRITAPLMYFQSSDFEAYERNPNSRYRQDYTNPAMQRVMHKIFVERSYIMNIQAVIDMTLDTSASDSIVYLHVRNEPYTTISNPHLRYFNCWDKAKREIAQSMAKGEYDVALMTMIAAVQTVNIAENPTFVEKTLRDIRNVELSKTIILTDRDTKQQITFYDAVKLEQQKLEEETKKAEEAASPPEARGYTQVVVEEEDITEELETLDEEMIREAENAFERSITDEVHQNQ